MKNYEGTGVLKKILLNPFCIGIILVSLLISVVLFDELRVYEFIINGIPFYLLFV